MNKTIRVNGERLWSRLMDMGKVGATAAGGCNRQALTAEDKIGRELFIGWCEAAGCNVRTDAIGNVFARRAGRRDDLPPVITGSHLDTQPTGGKYDGIYGVLAGLEVIETLNDHQIETDHPIDVVVWTNEEGCRFSVAMMGSAVWSGAMSIDDAYALTDLEGHTVREELERIGQRGKNPAAHLPVKAAFETHIEQGPVMEAQGKTIGVVTGVQHMSRHEIHIDGQEAHAGPTPMAMRKDPMMAVADFLPKLYALAQQHGEDSRITFGVVEVSPASNNTVPGHLMMTVDIRHPNKMDYDALVSESYKLVNLACRKLELSSTMHCFWEAPGVTFDNSCISAVRRAVAITGYEAMDIISGAGHDACNVSSVAPTSMIFIPCEGGLSHNEVEAATPEHVTAGANVLLHAMAELADVLST